MENRIELTPYFGLLVTDHSAGAPLLALRTRPFRRYNTTLIATATRQTSGEMDRGTTELAIALPLSRREFYLSGWSCSMIISVLLSVAPLLGIWIGSRLFEPFEPIRFSRFAIASINFMLLNLAVSSLAILIGVHLVRRGVAVALISAILILFVAMNFLESFLPAIQQVKFVSFLHYYRPGEVVRNEYWPIADMISLLAITTICSIAGATVWQYRDMPVP